jgi:hypothetical protein
VVEVLNFDDPEYDLDYDNEDVVCVEGVDDRHYLEFD